MKKNILAILTLVLTVIIGAQVANAIGSLTPSGTAGDATQYTLNDIYTKLTTNVATSTKSGLFTIPGSAVATFRTLSEIYAAIPTIDASKVAVGTTYLGVGGTAVVAPTLIWQTDPNLQLCHDADPSVGCTAGNGFLDPVGDQSVLLGAVEYCQYLDADGTTVQTTSQNVWRLPTAEEFNFITVYSNNPANYVQGFVGYYYWTSSPYYSNWNEALVWDQGNGFMQKNYKTTSFYVRCVR